MLNMGQFAFLPLSGALYDMMQHQSVTTVTLKKESLEFFRMGIARMVGGVHFDQQIMALVCFLRVVVFIIRIIKIITI